MTTAFASRPRSPVAKLILIWLADFADEDSRCVVEWSDLATFAMCSKDQAAGELAFLERDGFLVGEEGHVVRLSGAAA